MYLYFYVYFMYSNQEEEEEKNELQLYIWIIYMFDATMRSIVYIFYYIYICIILCFLKIIKNKKQISRIKINNIIYFIFFFLCLWIFVDVFMIFYDNNIDINFSYFCICNFLSFQYFEYIWIHFIYF